LPLDGGRKPHKQQADYDRYKAEHDAAIEKHRREQAAKVAREKERKDEARRREEARKTARSMERSRRRTKADEERKARLQARIDAQAARKARKK